MIYATTAVAAIAASVSTLLQEMTESLESISPIINNDSLKMHTHALILLLVYVLLHVVRVLGDNNSNESNAGKGKETTTPTSSLSLRLTTNSRSIELPAPLASSGSSIPASSDVSQASSAEVDNDDDSAISEPSLEELELELEKLCPQSTPAERRRFLVACRNNVDAAAARLRHYVEWHEKYLTVQSTTCCPRIRPTNDRDYDIWAESCLTAMKACGEVENIVLPRVIRSYPQQKRTTYSPKATVATAAARARAATYLQQKQVQEEYQQQRSNCVTDQEGHCIFHIIPAMMDDKLAKQSTYTLAVALYLDRRVDRHSMDTVTICLDVRAGKGWPNTHAVKLVPFMKSSLKLLLPLFPERLHKCVVYPLPSAFYFLWTMISKCMDAITAAKICVVSGKCTIEAPPPTDQLIAHLGEEPALLLEPSRVARFKA